MRRTLFNVATVVSLVCAVAVTALWVHSRTACDSVWHSQLLTPAYPTGSSVAVRYAFVSHLGSISVSRVRDERPNTMPFIWRHGWHASSSSSASNNQATAMVETHGRSAAGFGYVNRATRSNVYGSPFGLDYRGVVVPHWCIALLFLIPAIARALVWSRARRRAPNLCPTCGYDCRGPADGPLLARCPECGTDLPPLKAATDDQREEPAGATR